MGLAANVRGSTRTREPRDKARIANGPAIVSILSLSGAVAFAPDGAAQTRTDASSIGALKALSLEDLLNIVVTARRREESISSVPIAITALSGSELEDKRVETVSDLQYSVPSLNVSGSFSRQDYTVVIRGMGPTGGLGSPLGGGGTGVVSYFAEVPTSTAGPGLFFDLENVQVAKGPQGTLFGKNTTGGVLLLVPNKPSNNFEGSVEAGGGDYNLRTFTAVVNVPIIDERIMVRFAGQSYQRDGFTIDRGPVFPGQDYDNQNYLTGRVSVLIRLTGSFENYTIFSAVHNEIHGDGYVLSAVNPSNAFAALVVPFFTQQQATGIRSTALSTNEIDKRYNYGVINTTRWSTNDAVQFKNIASYQVQKWRNADDLDGTPFVILDLVGTTGWHLQTGIYTEEPQVQGTALGGKLNWTAGGYFEYGHNIAPQPYQVDLALGNFTVVQPDATNFERNKEAYGQVTYDLGGLSKALEALKLTAGYRESWDEFGFGIALYSPNAGNACLSGTGTYSPSNNCLFSDTGKSKGSSWTLGLDRQIDENTLVYIRSGRGYIPGGFNPTFGYAPGGTSLPQYRFRPESDTDVELGVKSGFTVAGMKAVIAADVFYTNFTNIQRLVTEVVPGQNNLGLPTNFTTNASEARIEGFEFQSSILPIKNFKVDASYSYNYGKYTKIDPAAAPSLVGIPFANLPMHKMSLATTYTLPLGPSVGEIAIGALYSYQSKYFDAPAVQPQDFISAYGLLNLGLDWKNIVGSSVDASAFVTNATDKVYRVQQFGTYATDGRIASLYGEPRMFGAQLRYRFGK